ncbi:hypothetical protein ACKLNR_004013 [Fusarium oxysporum f. sp. zingiberi]
MHTSAPGQEMNHRSDPASVRVWVWNIHIPRLWRSCVRVTAVVSEAPGQLPFRNRHALLRSNTYQNST